MAHVHGTIWKQWSHLFGDDREPKEKFTARRNLALGTLGLLVVLAAAAGSRYSVAMHNLSSSDPSNPFNFDTGINPLRDVMFSLLANVAAWLVGVFIASFAHDQDDEFMDATREYERSRKLYNRETGALTRQIETIRARYAKQIAEKETAAKVKTRGVEREYKLLLQVREHERAIVSAAATAIRGAAENYRSQLVQTALRQNTANPASIVRIDGAPITPYEFQNVALLIDINFVQGMMT